MFSEKKGLGELENWPVAMHGAAEEEAGEGWRGDQEIILLRRTEIQGKIDIPVKRKLADPGILPH